MAGGLGTRLRPLTEECPKPLIKVGGQPILQTVLEGFRAQGFHKFYISVNYKSEMIEQYFGDGRRWDASIEYLREEKRLGTAGPLSLLPETPESAVLVANGDLLTNLNFARLLSYHTEHRAMATMGVRQYSLQVPYGVIEIDGQCISHIQEKPTEKYFVNAGIYALEPDAVAQIPGKTFYDMPELFEDLIAAGEEVTAFPIQEYWQDIGQPDDLHRAQTDYQTVFASSR
jgi:NDP-sugar pyrophosphorylase family protein